MPKFISDEEMAKLEGPKKKIISDDEMANLEAKHASPFELKQPFSSKDGSENLQTAGDFLQSVREGIPLSEIGRKMDRATSAGWQALTKDKPFKETYNKLNEDAARESAERHQRSPTASGIGNFAGALTAPIGGLATNAGINVLDAASRGNSADEATGNAVKAGMVSAGASLIPGAGYVMKGLGKGANAIVDKVSKSVSGEASPYIADAAAFGIGAYNAPGGVWDKTQAGLVTATARRAMGKAIPMSKLTKAGDILQKVGDLPIKYQKLLVGTPQQVELTHFLLQKEDPEYRALTDGSQPNTK